MIYPSCVFIPLLEFELKVSAIKFTILAFIEIFVVKNKWTSINFFQTQYKPESNLSTTTIFGFVKAPYPLAWAYVVLALHPVIFTHIGFKYECLDVGHHYWFMPYWFSLIISLTLGSTLYTIKSRDRSQPQRHLLTSYFIQFSKIESYFKITIKRHLLM